PEQSTIYTLALHDALPIFKVSFTKPLDELGELEHQFLSLVHRIVRKRHHEGESLVSDRAFLLLQPNSDFKRLMESHFFLLKKKGDRKSTRLNSSHVKSSYA